MFEKNKNQTYRKDDNINSLHSPREVTEMTKEERYRGEHKVTLCNPGNGANNI